MVPAPMSSGADWVQKSCRSRNQVQSVHASSTVTLRFGFIRNKGLKKGYRKSLNRVFSPDFDISLPEADGVGLRGGGLGYDLYAK